VDDSAEQDSTDDVQEGAFHGQLALRISGMTRLAI
jgi:hypothetical protein